MKKRDELGTLIDALYRTRERRQAQQRKVDERKAEETLAEARVIAALQDARLTKAGGRKAAVSLQAKIVAQVDPARWADVFEYVHKKNAWDLLQKRINNAAFRDRVDGGEDIPGAKAVPVLDLSIRKI